MSDWGFNAGRLLRELQANPPGRSGQWWVRNRSRLIDELESARRRVCAYPQSRTCDCKYGLVPGGHDPLVIGSEHTGCPELRQMIHSLMGAEASAAVVPVLGASMIHEQIGNGEGLTRAAVPPAEPEVAAAQESEFRRELQHLINRHSAENGSNTPDFILATMLSRMLGIFDQAVQDRDHWYGVRLRPGWRADLDSNQRTGG